MWPFHDVRQNVIPLFKTIACPKLNLWYLSVQKHSRFFVHAWISGRNNFTAVALKTFMIFSFNFIFWPVSKFQLRQRSQKFIHQSISFCFNGLQQHVAKLIQRKITFKYEGSTTSEPEKISEVLKPVILFAFPYTTAKSQFYLANWLYIQ